MHQFLQRFTSFYKILTSCVWPLKSIEVGYCKMISKRLFWSGDAQRLNAYIQYNQGRCGRTLMIIGVQANKKISLMPVHAVIDTWMHGGGWVCVNVVIKQTCCPPSLDSKHELSTFHHGCKAALAWWYIPRRGLHIMSTLSEYIE